MFRKASVLALIFVFTFQFVFWPAAQAALVPPDESRNNAVTDPLQPFQVDPWSGNLAFSENDFLILNLVAPLHLQRSYRSDRSRLATGFGPGWAWNYRTRLLLLKNEILLENATGGLSVFQSVGAGVYKSSALPGQTITQKGNQFVHSRPVGMETIFDSAGRGIRIQDARKNGVTLERNGLKVMRVLNDFGQWIAMTWKGDRIVQTQDSAGRRVTYQYDQRKRLIHVTGVGGVKTSYAYDDTDRLTTITYADGKSIRIAYEERSGRVAEFASGLASASYRYSENKTTVTGRTGVRWTYATSPDGGQRKITNPWGGAWTMRFNKGRMVSSSNPYGGTSRFEYDAEGFLKTTINPLGHATKFKYHPRWHVPVEIRSANGAVERYNYDDHAQLIRFFDKTGRRGTFRYYANGLPREIKDPDGIQERITYNKQLLPFKYARGTYGVSALKYDKAGNPVRVTDPLGRTIKMEYDDAGRLTRSSRGEASLLSNQYNPAGRPIRVRTPGSPANRITYDAAGRVSSATSLGGSAIAYQRNADGLITRVRAPGKGAVNFTYKNDLLAEARDASGNTWAYSYNKAGSLTKIQNPDGSATTVRYNKAGNLIGKKYSSGTWSKMTYDAEDRLIEVATDKEKVALEYDETGRLTFDRISSMPAIRATYARQGKDYSLFVGDTEIQYVHDSAGKLEQVIVVGGPYASFRYDKSGMIKSVERSNDVSTTWRYDKAGRADRIVHQDIAGKIVVARGYTFDNSHRVIELKKLPQKSAQRLSYTPDGKLSRVSGNNGIAVAYGPGGLRKKVKQGEGPVQAYQHGPTGKLLQAGDTQYQYDVNGNRTLKKSLAGSYRLKYDGEGHIVRATLGGNAIEYSYDGLGRRVAISKNGQTERILYFGLDPVAIADATGNIRRIFVPGPSLDFPLFLQSAGHWFAYHQDIIGSILALTDDDGQTVGVLDYSPFGIPAQPAISGNPFGFAGMWFDEDTGLYYVRARTYDPQTGNFLQPDPLPGYVDQPETQAFYAYAGGNPISYRDPKGAAFFVTLLTVGAIAYGAYEGGKMVMQGFEGLLHNPTTTSHASVGSNGETQYEYKELDAKKIQESVLKIHDGLIKLGDPKGWSKGQSVLNSLNKVTRNVTTNCDSGDGKECAKELGDWMKGQAEDVTKTLVGATGVEGADKVADFGFKGLDALGDAMKKANQKGQGGSNGGTNKTGGNQVAGLPDQTPGDKPAGTKPAGTDDSTNTVPEDKGGDTNDDVFVESQPANDEASDPLDPFKPDPNALDAFVPDPNALDEFGCVGADCFADNSDEAQVASLPPTPTPAPPTTPSPASGLTPPVSPTPPVASLPPGPTPTLSPPVKPPPAPVVIKPPVKPPPAPVVVKPPVKPPPAPAVSTPPVKPPPPPAPSGGGTVDVLGTPMTNPPATFDEAIKRLAGITFKTDYKSGSIWMNGELVASGDPRLMGMVKFLKLGGQPLVSVQKIPKPIPLSMFPPKVLAALRKKYKENLKKLNRQQTKSRTSRAAKKQKAISSFSRPSLDSSIREEIQSAVQEQVQESILEDLMENQVPEPPPIEIEPPVIEFEPPEIEFEPPPPPPPPEIEFEFNHEFNQ